MRTILVALTCTGCASAAAPHPADTPGVRIASTAFAKKNAMPGQHLVMRFVLAANGTNGTELIRRFLDAAQGRQATYVSRVALVLQFFKDGEPVECSSSVVVEDGSQAPAPATAPRAPTPPPTEEPMYSTDVEAWRPATITADVVDQDLRCKKVARQVEVEVPVVEDRFAAEHGRAITMGGVGTKMDQVIVWSDQCSLQPVKRHVVRYEHYVAGRFVPVDWARIGREFSSWKLREEPPQCHPITLPAGRKLVHRIEADLHHVGRTAATKQGDRPGSLREGYIYTHAF